MSALFRGLAAGFLFCAAAVPVAAANPYTAEAMWGLARIGNPTLSPDGRLAVVPVTRYDLAANKGSTDLWMIPTDGGPARQLTSDKASDTAPAFSPDGSAIAFLSKRGDDTETQIYVIATDGGEARRVTDIPVGVGAVKWFPDGKRLAFVADVWPELTKWEDQGKRLKERAEAKTSAKVWERAPIAYWDHFLDDREPHLFSIALEGGEPVAITRGSGYWLSKQEYGTSSYDISPDGTEVAFVADRDRTGIDANDDIIVIPACGCKPARNLNPESVADESNPVYSPDGRYLAYAQKRTPRFYADTQRLMLLERATDRTRGLTEQWDRSADGLVWARDSKSIYGVIDDAATSRIYRFTLAGGTPRAVTGASSFSGLEVAGKTAVALRQGFSEPATLVRLDPASGTVTKLSQFNDVALANLAMGKVESVTYAGARGDPVQMWVIYPPGFDPAKKYPVYMLLHGGPHNGIQDALTYRWNAHVFANWGYIVTWHNFHGSSGFGQAFADSINPDRITMPYEDTIKAAEWLAAQPFVDAGRMVAGGGSYGGFLATTLLGRPHPFKALIAHAAVYDNFTQIGADYGASKERFFNYWEKPEEFARYSPHTAAGNFVTPTLVIHGQLDQRVPVNHGIELFNTLQTRGVPSKLVYFPDENHWVLKPGNSLFWYQTVHDWLAKYAPVTAGSR
ncbi:MAG: Dipeptidyl-peptidase 5 [Steroidobacteraceae bacterium]|nr:Dipeptidyl-peptidase 5 [Steroidobacteraceae bacterium]